jgi:hypothetical protein
MTDPPLKPISQIAAPLYKNLRETAAKTPRLIEAAHTIRNEAPEMRPILFLSPFLIKCTLPHSDPGDVPIWMRTNNEHTLAIQPGWDIENKRPLGLPWGRLPRLLLIWMVTEAKRTGCRRLELGNSLTEFLRKINLDPHGRGKRSDAKRVKDAMQRLFGCHIIYEKKLGIGAVIGQSVKEFKVAPERELWWDVGPNGHAVLWGSWIELGHSFFADIMESTVPFNMRAIQALRSPLSLDLYLLCNWLGATRPNGHFLSWGMLARQMGGDYAKQDDLKKNVQKALRQVKIVHPDLKASCVVRRINGVQQGGIFVRPSEPAIPRRRAASA